MEELPTIQELSRGEGSTSRSYASTPLSRICSTGHQQYGDVVFVVCRVH